MKETNGNVIIILGASHTGKTMLAQKLLEKYNYPYLSLDHLKMGLIRSKNTNLSVYDDDKLVSYLWPIAKEMIKTAIENKQNLIVEGCYIPFNFLTDFDKEYLDYISYFALAFSDDFVNEHFQDIVNHSKDIEDRKDINYLSKDYVLNENRKYRNGYDENNLHYLLVTEDYDLEINKIIDQL